MTIDEYEILEDELGDIIDADLSNYGLCCPFCESLGHGKDFNFKLRIHKETSYFKCWRCETSGKSIKSLFHKLGLNYYTQYSLVDFNSKLLNSLTPHEQVPKSYSTVADTIQDLTLYPMDTWTSEYEYLQSRNISKDQIDHYQLLVGHAKTRKLKIVTGVFFPVIMNDELRFWQIRRTERNTKFKHYNCFNINKSSVIFNHDHTYDTTIICEGILSAISAGYNAEGLLGKYVSVEKIDLLCSKNRKIYYCCLEADFYKHNINLARQLYARGKDVRVVILPIGKDPNDMSKDEFQTCLDNSIKYDNTKLTLIRLECAYKAII